jgi:hypothetical protein
MEEIPESYPCYRDVDYGSVFIWFMIPNVHVHAYRVVYKNPRVAEVDFKLVQCWCNYDKMDKLYQEQLSKNFKPCTIGEVETLSWEMSILKDRARWLITPAQKILFGDLPDERLPKS